MNTKMIAHYLDHTGHHCAGWDVKSCEGKTDYNTYYYEVHVLWGSSEDIIRVTSADLFSFLYEIMIP